MSLPADGKISQLRSHGDMPCLPATWRVNWGRCLRIRESDRSRGGSVLNVTGNSSTQLYIFVGFACAAWKRALNIANLSWVQIYTGAENLERLCRSTVHNQA